MEQERDRISTGTEEPAGTLRDRLKRARLEPWRQKRPRVEKTRPCRDRGHEDRDGSMGRADPRAITEIT